MSKKKTKHVRKKSLEKLRIRWNLEFSDEKKIQYSKPIIDHTGELPDVLDRAPTKERNAAVCTVAGDNSAMRSYLKQETYMEYLEWQLYHSGVKLSKIEGEIEEFFLSSEILSRKSLLIGSFYKTDYWSPRWKVQKLKEINFRFGELLRGCVGNEAFSLKLWNELYIYWLGTRSVKVI